MHPQDTILTLTCESCGTVFQRPRAHMRRSRRAYCSRRCCGDAKRILPTLSGVYAIVHRPTGHIYIGSTRNLAIRWGGHRAALNTHKHRSQRLQTAWDTDGRAAFDFVVLEAVPAEPTSNLVAREQAWMDRYRAEGRELFNRSPLAASTRGLKASTEARARLSVSHRFHGRFQPADILAIKATVATGVSLVDAATQYATTRHTVYCIVTGRMWPDVRATDEIESALLTVVKPHPRRQQ